MYRFLRLNKNITKNQSAVLLSQKTQFSAYAFSKIGTKAIRFPLVLISLSAGFAGYLEYKFQQFTKFLIPEWLKGFLEIVKLNLDHFYLKFKNTKSSQSTNDHSSLHDDLKIKSDSNFRENEKINNTVSHKTSKTPEKGSERYKEDNKDHLYSELIKKLCELKRLLNSIDKNPILLPNIVVIGSQSSGKSSVLESIVGKSFLPKGEDMVTRRPIELTLVNTPDIEEEYAIFSEIHNKKYTNFKEIQQVLSKLNSKVSDSEVISDKPIKLEIYSKDVPDLTLIDLPGYIQVNKMNQPKLLKQKIQNLCQKYINGQNIILTICAADVDLANSEALLVARNYDSKGIRTLGVITKLDLVETQNAIKLLKNNDYSLNMGYIGVICKNNTENEYLNKYKKLFSHHGLDVGVDTLKKKLVHILEKKIKQSLNPLIEKIEEELEDSKYQYKVVYNDREITAESYVADTMDTLKHQFKLLESKFTITNTQSYLNFHMQQKVLDICAKYLWSNKNAKYDVNELEFAVNKLVKSGIGKYSTQLIIKIVNYKITQILNQKPFTYHNTAYETIIDFTEDIIKSRYKQTVEQVENSVKPYKNIIQCDQSSWNDSRSKSILLITKELEECKSVLNNLTKLYGTYQLRKLIEQYKNSPFYTNSSTNNQISDKDLKLAEQILFLEDRINVLNSRVHKIKSKLCKSPINKEKCSEIYMMMIASKLVESISLFLQIEFINEFCYMFPRYLDNHIVYKLDSDFIKNFAQENPIIMKQIQLKTKIKKLNEVLSRLKYLSYQINHNQD